MRSRWEKSHSIGILGMCCSLFNFPIGVIQTVGTTKSIIIYPSISSPPSGRLASYTDITINQSPTAAAISSSSPVTHTHSSHNDCCCCCCCCCCWRWRMLLLGEWILLLLGIVGGYTTAMIRRAESRPADDGEGHRPSSVYYLLLRSFQYIIH